MKNRLIKVIIRDVLLLLILVGYYFFNKYTGKYIPCIIHEITGYKCPGCGITHLVFSLLHLDFHKAFISNPLVFIYMPFIIVYFVYLDYLYIYDKKDKILKRIPNIIWIILIIITLAYGVIRNIIGF